MIAMNTSRYGDPRIGAMLDRALEVLPHLAQVAAGAASGAAGGAPQTGPVSDQQLVSLYRVQLETASRLMQYVLTGELAAPTLQLPPYTPEPRSAPGAALQPVGIAELPAPPDAAPAAAAPVQFTAQHSPQTSITLPGAQAQYPRQLVKFEGDLGSKRLEQPVLQHLAVTALPRHLAVIDLPNRQHAALTDSQELGSTTFIMPRKPQTEEAQPHPQTYKLHELQKPQRARVGLSEEDLHLGSATLDMKNHHRLQPLERMNATPSTVLPEMPEPVPVPHAAPKSIIPGAELTPPAATRIPTDDVTSAGVDVADAGSTRSDPSGQPVSSRSN